MRFMLFIKTKQLLSHHRSRYSGHSKRKLNGIIKFRIFRENYNPGLNVPLLSLELELADELIIGTLGGILMKAFGQSSFFQRIV